MTDTISFTIPLNYKYLNNMIEYLQNMVLTLEEESIPIPDDRIPTSPTQDMELKFAEVNITEHIDNTVDKLTNLTPIVDTDVPSSLKIKHPNPTHEYKVTETIEGTETLPQNPNQQEFTQTTITPTPINDDAAFRQAHPEDTPTGVDLDSKGLPWDARIHSSGKTKLKGTGAWKPARGIAGTPLLAQVEAELRAAMAMPDQTPDMIVPPGQPVIGDPAPPPTHTSNVVANPSSTPPPPATVTWSECMEKITLALADEKNPLNEQAVIEACNANGLASLSLVGARPDLIPAILAALGL